MWLLACAAVAARAAPTCPPGALEGGSCAELADEALEEVRRSPQAAEWDAEDAEDEEWSEEDFEEVGTDDWEAARDVDVTSDRPFAAAGRRPIARPRRAWM